MFANGYLHVAVSFIDVCLLFLFELILFFLKNRLLCKTIGEKLHDRIYPLDSVVYEILTTRGRHPLR